MHFEMSTFLSVIASLIILEVLLSADNALVNASMARHLPYRQQVRAIRTGIVFGAGFRLLALIFASLIIHNIWLKTAGALYLIFLSMNHLGKEVVEGEVVHPRMTNYRNVVIRIAVADMIFGLDNVISAVGISSNLVYVIIGVGIGITAMLLLSQFMIRVIERYRRLANAAYIIVGLIGVFLLLEVAKHTEVSPLYKFLAIISIISLTLWYEYDPKLRAITRPVLLRLRLIMGLPTDIYRLITKVLFFQK